ncbi:transmembrane protein, partial [Cystoisospora suis]
MRSRRTLAVLASPWVSLFSAGCGAVAVYEASRLKQKKRELLSLLHDAAGICSVAGQAAPHTFKDVCYGSGAEPAVCVFQGVGHPEILSAAKVAAIAAGITPDAVSLSQLAAGVAAADVFLTAQSTRTVSNLFFRSSRQGYSSGPGASVSPEATDIGSREEEKDDECRGCLPSYSSPVQGKGVSVGRVVSARVVRKPLEFSWSHGLRWPRRFLRIKYQYFVPYTGKEKDAAPRESSTSGRDSGSEGAVQPSFLVGTDRVLPVTARILGKRDQGQGYTRFADHGTSQTVSEDIPGTSEVSTQHLQRRESGKAAQWSILSWFNFWSYFRARSREEYPKLQGQQSPDILFNIYEGTAELRLAPGDGPRADNEETVSVRPPPGTVADHRLRAVEQIDPTCGPVAPPEGQCGPANQVCAARPPPAEPATKVTRSSLHGRYISHTPATPANVTQLKEEG